MGSGYQALLYNLGAELLRWAGGTPDWTERSRYLADARQAMRDLLQAERDQDLLTALGVEARAVLHRELRAQQETDARRMAHYQRYSYIVPMVIQRTQQGFAAAMIQLFDAVPPLRRGLQESADLTIA